MPSISDFIDPHRSWALWVQAPLLLWVLLLTGRSLWGERGDRSTVAGALLAVLAVAIFLPWDAVPWSGHEGHYQELLRGGPAEAGSLESTNTFPFPAGLAWTMGILLPPDIAEATWRLGNRLALAAVLLGMAAIARALGGAPAGRYAVGLGLCAIPLLGWSTTGYALVPAMAMASAGFVLALRGDTPGGLAWLGLAAATRMEWAPLVLGLGLVALARAPRDPGTPSRWVAAAGVLGCEYLVIASKHSGLPGPPNPFIARENLWNIPLGGPWFAWTSLLAVATLWLAMPPRAMPRALTAAWLACLALTLGSLSTLVDLGARHLLPATLLLVPVVAASLARRHEREVRWGTEFAVGLAIAILPLAVRDGARLHHRISEVDTPGVLPSQEPPTSRFAVLETLDPACLLAVPGGERTFAGAMDSEDVGNVHHLGRRRAPGQCVYWAVRAGVRYSGDTRLEFVDRAVRTLHLNGQAWIDRGDERWLLFEARDDP